MRLEINIPDSTRPDLKARLISLTKRLSARPELVDELVSEKTEAVPDYMASIAQIRQSPNRFKTPAEVDAFLADLRAEW
jgi:hypothetical protein